MEQNQNERNFEETKLLYPEVLDKSELLHMLKEKKIPVDESGLTDKMTLLELCYKNLVPQPQRSYRRNRRGQAMTRKQIKMYGHSPSDSTKVTSNHFSNSVSGLPLSAEKLRDGGRLKPPPCGNGFKTSTPWGDRLKPPPGGDRLKPPPCADGLNSPPSDNKKPSPSGCRLKPPVCMTSSKLTENKVIRLATHCSSTSDKTEGSNKRNSPPEDEKSPVSKRIRFESSTGKVNQTTDNAIASLKRPQEQLEAPATKKFTKICWP